MTATMRIRSVPMPVTGTVRNRPVVLDSGCVTWGCDVTASVGPYCRECWRVTRTEESVVCFECQSENLIALGLCRFCYDAIRVRNGSNARYYAEHAEEIKARVAAWGKANGDKARARRRAYKARNRDKVNAAQRRRRAAAKARKVVAK